jgi:hypothetical protein
VERTYNQTLVLCDGPLKQAEEERCSPSGSGIDMGVQARWWRAGVCVSLRVVSSSAVHMC